MTRRAFTPRPYQHEMIAHMLDTPRCALWAGMGLGKTVSTLSALDALSMVESAPTLVLAPLRVAATTWPDEVAKWDHLSGLSVVPIIGTPGEREAALRRDAAVYTTNYENVPWLVEHFGAKWPFRTIVADESTRLKSFRLKQGGRRAQALARVAHTKASRFIELTGTPSPNGLQDLWGQAWFLDRGERLGHSFGAFEARWFRSVQMGSTFAAKRLDPFPFAQAQIEDALRDVCLSLDAADHFDLDEPIVNDIRVELPPAARRAYEAMEDEMFLALDSGGEIEAVNAASRTIKCLQLANGAIYTDGACTAWEEIHDAKIRALEEIVEEAAGAPVLVAYHFKTDAARLMRAFPRGRMLDKDPATIRDWNAGRIPVLFAHPASAGHGLNLQDGGNILAFFGHWWDLEQYQQIVERIGPTRQAQAGHKRPVFIHHILAARTVDELVHRGRQTKRRVQDVLLEAMKARRT
jgi:SNF2 family DNA or RNA helicase